MGKHRSIAAQLNHAISMSYTDGSKRSAKLDSHQKSDHKIYSRERSESLHKLANKFGTFLKENYPETRFAKDITRAQVQDYLSQNESNWSKRTSEEYCSTFRKLEKIIQHHYSRKASFADNLIAKQTDTTDYRNKAMTREDYIRLRDSFSKSNSVAKVGLELAYRFGLRSCECVGLRAEQIDLKNKVLHLGSYCKNGKHRDVPIRDKDFSYIKAVKEQVGLGRVCPIKEESLNRTIRYHMKKLGSADTYLKTTTHAIRKLYASERMQELRGAKNDPATSDGERRAWGVVQKELGHGEKFRMALYETYIKG